MRIGVALAASKNPPRPSPTLPDLERISFHHHTYSRGGQCALYVTFLETGSVKVGLVRTCQDMNLESKDALRNRNWTDRPITIQACAEANWSRFKMDGLAVNLSELEVNGNCAVNKSNSQEDLSEYTDADESISAPTEILAEFLSAVMLKDYETALKYCNLILQYEPHHTTAKEFHPLILEKISQAALNSKNRNEESGSTTSSSSPDGQEERGSEEDDEDEEGDEENEEGGDDDDDEEEDDEELSEEYSSGADSSGGLGNSSDERRRNGDSDATTASYSSLEDEEAGNAPPFGIKRQLPQPKHDNDFVENGNNTATSDSESPTEPVSQRMIPSTLPVK
ncbi:Hypothetical protein NTJ_07997 [Nesidiocoris tenuis]|uniref:Glutamate-rich protein 2 n=1 Tax=Nesidiocoris tenuis TaxID=355587 RepID=A0ABN7ASJ8_9HEMI|nr:Hypothetical protein NTJ_07997 [Nesidiocoris tenuis]